MAMESARVTLLDCTISGCKGPGLDCSSKAQATIQGGSIHSNVGGVWVWDGAAAVLRGAAVAGGPSFALLADGWGSLDVQVRQRWWLPEMFYSHAGLARLRDEGGGLACPLLLLLVLLQCCAVDKQNQTRQACT